MPTIREIAEMAGVSRGTVDRVLNHRGKVNPETEEKIQSILTQLHYTPNRAGMALAAQKNRFRIGVILFSKKNPFFNEVMDGLLEKAQELALYGCELVVKRVAYDPEAQLSAIRACLQEGIRGLIITPYNSDAVRSALNRLISGNIPVVTVNSDIEGTDRLSYVGSNYTRSGKAAGALMKLITSGTVHVGIINGDRQILCHAQRSSGFLEELSADPRFCVVAEGENYDDDARSYALVSEMLHAHPEINALYFTAAGVYGGCRAIADNAQGRPLRILTYDDVPTTVEMLQRGIITATICQAPNWQGAKALEVLFGYLSGALDTPNDSYYAELTIKTKELTYVS